MRDKLIELIDNNKACPYDFPCKECTYNDEPSCFSPRLADELIANGVTIGKDNNVITNGDRIRAMTDAELATWIMFNADGTCRFCKPEMRTSKRCNGCCTNGIIAWLKQPVEGEHD